MSITLKNCAWLWIILFILPTFLHASAVSPSSPHLIEGLTQGTNFRVLYRGPENSTLKAGIERRLAEIDAIFSNYRPDSEISRFNADQSLGWFAVSPALVDLVEFSEKISRGSRGAFDITIGPLLKVWGFGPYKQTLKELPNSAAIKQAQAAVDYRRLAWRKQPAALRKKDPRLLVDVSGVAQGYSVDALAQLLEAKGLKHYLVEIGGEVRARGDKGAEGSWQILLDNPSVEPTAIRPTVFLKDMSVTTAGDYRNYFEKDGVRYSHIIDPRSGRPIQHKLAAVSVLASTALEADGWDTALLILGPEAARAVVKEQGLASYFVVNDGQDFIGEATPAFAQALKK